MMNKKQFISALKKWCTENNVKLYDVYASHGGVLLLLNLKLTTEDIDLNVTQEVWDKFVNQGFQVVELSGGTKLMSVTDKIDIHIGHHESKDLVIHSSGVKMVSPEQTILDYQKLNRPKDQKSIRLLTEYLSKQ